MWTWTNVLLCSFVVVVAEGDLKLERPYLRVEENSQAQLRCCRTASSELLTTTWFVKTKSNNKAAKVNESDGMIIDEVTRIDTTCHTLLLKSVHLNHTGLYQCQLSTSDLNITSPGTYLHVVPPITKTINLSEITKNRILVTEGIALLLCVLLASAFVLFKSKKHHELTKKRMTKEEENIYQGLNLDECCTTYDQIERSQGPYQDVCNVLENDEIQLEKP